VALKRKWHSLQKRKSKKAAEFAFHSFYYEPFTSNFADCFTTAAVLDAEQVYSPVCSRCSSSKIKTLKNFTLFSVKFNVEGIGIESLNQDMSIGRSPDITLQDKAVL